MAGPVGRGGFYAVCDCCGLEYSSREAQRWTERTQARRLKILESDGPRDGNPYREYWVEHEHRVCPTCHANLVAGGKFRALHRNRGKLGVMLVVAALALAIVTLPLTLPPLMSALRLLPGQR